MSDDEDANLHSSVKREIAGGAVGRKRRFSRLS